MQEKSDLMEYWERVGSLIHETKKEVIWLNSFELPYQSRNIPKNRMKISYSLSSKIDGIYICIKSY